MLKPITLNEIIEEAINFEIGEGFDFCEDEEENTWRRIEKQDFYDNNMIMIGGYGMDTCLIDISDKPDKEQKELIETGITHYFEMFGIPNKVYIESE